MPISALQHRAATGYHQNKLYNKVKKSATRVQNSNQNRSSPTEEIRDFTNELTRVINSDDRLERVSQPNTAPQRQIIATALMLLCRLDDTSRRLSTTAYNPEFGSGTELSPSFYGDTSHPANNHSIVSTYLKPIAYAAYGIVNAIPYYDPLKFPGANAAALPVARGNEIVYEALNDCVNKELIHELAGRDVLATTTGVPVNPIILSSHPHSEAKRHRRANINDIKKSQNTAHQKYLDNNCHIRTKTNQGTVTGNNLLVAGEIVRNPIRAAAEKSYKKMMGGHEMPQGLVNFSEAANLGTDIGLGIMTLGAYPIIKYASAKALSTSGHAVNGDMACLKNEYSPEEMANLLFNTEVGITDRYAFHDFSVPPKPGELKNARPFKPDGVFVHENVANKISTVKYMTVNHHGTEYHIREKSPGEFWTFHPLAVKPDLVEQRVYFDAANKKVHFNRDLPEGHGLDLDISEGKNFIRLDGDYYEVTWNWETKRPEIVLSDIKNESPNVAVYMEPISKTWHLSTHNNHPVFNNKQMELIQQIKVKKEEGFNYIAKENNNKKYYGDGKIYVQQKVNDDSNYPWGRHIELNGELVPVREVITPKHGVHYEVYDLKTPDKQGYPVEWSGNRWIFEQKTSVHVSEDLEKTAVPEMFSHTVDSGLLSAPDHQGLRYDAHENKYIKINGKYLKLEQRKDLPFVRMDNGDKIYVSYADNKFSIKKIDRYNGAVTSSYHEMKNDFQINSSSGFEIHGKSPLNEAWSLQRVTVRNSNFDEADTIGSGIDVVFTMKYNKLKNKEYIEMPLLEWKEKIDFKSEESKWQFQTDMYDHNPNSKTFFPWRNRYTEAYSFSKIKDKTDVNGYVKIYKNNMQPVGVNDIKNAYTPEEMTKNVQDYLAKNGGIMEVTITDLPQILKRDTISKERKVEFNIGFNDKVFAHFHQGISIGPNGKTNVFVTTSDNIKLAKGKVNAQPPEIVKTRRERHPMKGEVY